ncbi:arsenite-transporting ATPase [Actinopolyspora lacussalsi subsp. righensis]|uniref:Arsenite-transporting ATPase n=1 Tax=Actinopolyspora righensis TaxID=995060 RepID=A0A1I7AW96_9ACTN|nr:ArsA family ATPase [Actinopolyspora righensis]SFT79165.1 arsenite-transporting ATPase [Actinopolyspora righensis]
MRILMFTGKGGVGKTTLAAATAARAAAHGREVLVISTDPAHSLADCLDTELDDTPRPLRLSDDSESDPLRLHAAEIRTRGLLDRAWSELREHLHTVLAGAGVSEVDAAELTRLPAVEELLALTEVRRMATDGPWDTVVVDCGPTADTLRLLTMPEALSGYLERLFPTHRRVVRGMLAGMAGSDLTERWDAAAEALGGLAERLNSLAELLVSPATSVRLVATPESLVAAETRRILTSLALQQVHVDGVLANRVVPDPGSARGAAAAWLRTRAGQQREVLRELAQLGLPLHTVEHRATEPRGGDSLLRLGDEIYGETDPTSGAERTPVIELDGSGSDSEARYTLRIAMPLSRQAEFDLARIGDELAVTVDGHRRLITLPSVLRRCVAVEADAGDDGVTVTFRPDPAQWMR